MAAGDREDILWGESMRASVLSGAGNFGAMQAGAIEPLLETSFCPELIVGTSAGALNGLLLTSEPTAEGPGARKLPGSGSACARSARRVCWEACVGW